MKKLSAAIRKLIYLHLLYAACSLLGAQAFAADGRLEINQACVAQGCFDGDDPGFPVTISSPGSYVFTSNLDVRGEVDPEHVTAVVMTGAPKRGYILDLNGFHIIGPTTCVGTPTTSCENTGAGEGVSSSVSGVIKNGYIRGMGDACIDAGPLSRVENMGVDNCGVLGIRASMPGGMFINNVIRHNGLGGLSPGHNSFVRGNLIHGNGGTGLNAAPTTGYLDNVMTDNATDVNSGINMGGNLCTGALCL